MMEEMTPGRTGLIHIWQTHLRPHSFTLFYPAGIGRWGVFVHGFAWIHGFIRKHRCMRHCGEWTFPQLLICWSVRLYWIKYSEPAMLNICCIKGCLSTFEKRLKSLKIKMLTGTVVREPVFCPSPGNYTEKSARELQMWAVTVLFLSFLHKLSFFQFFFLPFFHFVVRSFVLPSSLTSCFSFLSFNFFLSYFHSFFHASLLPFLSVFPLPS